GAGGDTVGGVQEARDRHRAGSDRAARRRGLRARDARRGGALARAGNHGRSERRMTERKLDIFPHIFPLEYFERMKRIAEGNPGLAASLKRWMHIPVLWDLDQRIKMMQRWPGYQQVLTLSMPAIEFLGTPEETPGLARLANDGMAEIVRKHPDLFPCFVASLLMNNVPA